MRVLVTGATGFAGSHAVEALTRAGHSIRALVRDAEKLRRTFSARGLPVPESCVGDMTDEASVERAMEGCDAVLHAAGVISVEAKRGDEVMRSNIRGTELVVGAAVERGIERIVYLSSVGAIFDPHTETTPDSPVAAATDAYSRSKAHCEDYVRGLQAEGAPIATLYPSAIQGPDDPGMSESTFALYTFVRTCVFDTSGGYLAVDVRDLATAQRALLETGRPGRFIAAGHFLGWREIADLVEEITGGRVRRIPGPGWLFRGLGRAGDLAKRLVPFEFPMTREAMMFVTQMRPVKSSPELGELGVHFRDPRETFEDGVRWLLEAGHVEPRYAPRLSGTAEA